MRNIHILMSFWNLLFFVFADDNILLKADNIVSERAEAEMEYLEAMIEKMESDEWIEKHGSMDAGSEEYMAYMKSFEDEL